jgi:hypothetical protein
VNVGSQPNVICQIPAVVIGILVDYDIVCAPVPVIAISKVICGHGEIESAEPEAARASTFYAKCVSFAEAAGESPVLPGMVNMIVRVVFP